MYFNCILITTFLDNELIGSNTNKDDILSLFEASGQEKVVFVQRRHGAKFHICLRFAGIENKCGYIATSLNKFLNTKHFSFCLKL